ncbi:jg18738 [Pararge aegeria aegeria]|uniref:Jg18738 protein n=1 Tax=Pararge aegeria aegeria TaxID=348720 RepID=A0A8S4QSR6_9NEOP|nr:jg18738 [Pararge aegeria aegeria]
MNSERKLVGPHSSGKRNNNGQRLIDFAHEHNLFIMNTFYKIKANRKWTWISSNGNVKNEIDFIMTNKPKLFMDVSVINQLSFYTDHRMVRDRLHESQLKQSRKNIKRIKQHVILPIPQPVLKDLEQALQSRIIELKSIQEKYDIFEQTIKEIENKNAQNKAVKDKIGREAREHIMKRSILSKEKPKIEKK